MFAILILHSLAGGYTSSRSAIQSEHHNNLFKSKSDTMAEGTKSQDHEIVSADESQDGQVPGVLCPDVENNVQ